MFIMAVSKADSLCNLSLRVQSGFSFMKHAQCGMWVSSLQILLDWQ